MTIPHSPTAVSFIRRRQSLSCRRHEEENLHGESSYDDLTLPEKVPPVSRIGSGWNRTVVKGMNAKGDTLFAAFPVELRVEVFLQFCGVYCPIGKCREGPMMLLQICRAWKELALQTPQLWTSFALDFRPLPSLQKREFLLLALKGWIDRSRNLPISFKLHYPVFDATCADLIQCILPSSIRWRDITLSAPTASLLPLWAAEPNSLLSLRALTMESVGAGPFALEHWGINWAQLTELDLFLVAFPTLDECYDILAQAVNLTRCSMNASCAFSSDNPEQISLPKLEHLRFTLYGEDIGGFPSDRPESKFLAFLETLSLSGIESLRIGWNVKHGPTQAYYWSGSCNRFAAFLKVLGGHLSSLHLAYLPFSTPQILQCLAVIPSLSHLKLSFSQGDKEHDSINDELLSVLTQQPGESGLLPALQSIRMESHGEAYSNPVLLRFIASRWKFQKPSVSGHQLEAVDLISPKRAAEYRRGSLKDTKEGRLQVAARLRSEIDMVQVLSSFLNRDSYEMISFMNGDFPLDIRSLLIFD
ncbi:hypothetical protein C8R43DRAFT_947110 [Mycena crocata]|nr:hypothetical protein C8R43DRAFT_947110 [Mycena crocata]